MEQIIIEKCITLGVYALMISIAFMVGRYTAQSKSRQGGN